MSKAEFDLGCIKRATGYAIADLGLYSNEGAPQRTTMYTMLSKRFPIYVDDAIPLNIKKYLKQRHTCACADSGHIYLSTDEVKRILDSAPESMSMYIGLADQKYDIEALIIHEYTHILMQHLVQLNQFIAQSGNAKNVKTFTLACEIEANRGYHMPHTTNIYRMGVTEEAFPEVKGVYGIREIYKVLKQHYGDEIDEQMNAKKGISENKEENKEQQEGNEGSSESQEEGEELNESKTTGLSKEQEELLDRYKDDFEEREEAARSIEEGEEENEDEGRGVSISGGKGATSKASQPQSAYDVLKAYNNIHNQSIIKADLSKLKGILAGTDVSIGREKTYSRPARRDGVGGLMKKGTKKGHYHAPKVLIGMDSSGSMSSTTMQEVLNTISDIIKVTGRGMRGSYICEHDSYVKHLAPLYEYKRVVKGYCASGGNNFNDLLRAAIRCGVEAVVNVGDGYDEFTNGNLMQQAKAANIKWFDVIINPNVEKHQIEEIIEHEKSCFGDNYIGRTVLKLK